MKTLRRARETYQRLVASGAMEREWLQWPGCQFLADAVGPVEPGRIIVLGGRTGAGKSMFGLHAMASCGAPSLYVSLEDSENEVARRVSAMPDDALDRIVLDCPTHRTSGHVAASMESTRAHLLRAAIVAPEDPWLVVVDYLQLLAYSGAIPAFARTEAIGHLMGDLAAAARETRAVIMLNVQLSRPGKDKSAEPPAPTLYDIRDSANVENGANVVLLLHAEGKDRLNVRIAKHKHRQAGGSAVFTRGREGYLTLAKQAAMVPEDNDDPFSHND